jgi:hypothetical protein
MIPSKRLVLVAMGANWGKHEPGSAASPTNQHLLALVQS